MQTTGCASSAVSRRCGLACASWTSDLRVRRETLALGHRRGTSSKVVKVATSSGRLVARLTSPSLAPSFVQKSVTADSHGHGHLQCVIDRVESAGPRKGKLPTTKHDHSGLAGHICSKCIDAAAKRRGLKQTGGIAGEVGRSADDAVLPRLICRLICLRSSSEVTLARRACLLECATSLLARPPARFSSWPRATTPMVGSFCTEVIILCFGSAFAERVASQTVLRFLNPKLFRANAKPRTALAARARS